MVTHPQERLSLFQVRHAAHNNQLDDRDRLTKQFFFPSVLEEAYVEISTRFYVQGFLLGGRR